MRRLIPEDRERGSVAALVAILFAGGVIMGMLALTVDVGQIMSERRQLQNGADAASLALADVCAKNVADCTPAGAETRASLSTLINANAKDGASGFDLSRPGTDQGLCARAAGTGLPLCPSATTTASMSNLKECPPLPDWLTTVDGAKIPYVEAYTRTLTTSGSTILPKTFSQLLVGGGTDTTVGACARAAWGGVGSYSGTIPFTFSTCEWDEQTNTGQTYVDRLPPYSNPSNPWPTASQEVVIYSHDNTDPSQKCAWNSKDFPGGFGWVSNDDCRALVETGGWLDADPGNGVPKSCKDLLPTLVGTVVTLPVFDCVLPGKTAPTGQAPVGSTACNPTTPGANGTHSWYHVAGWAKFYLSGYRLSGASHASPVSGMPCSGSQRCISGWYVKGQLDATSITPPGSGSDFGTFAVLPAG